MSELLTRSDKPGVTLLLSTRDWEAVKQPTHHLHPRPDRISIRMIITRRKQSLNVAAPADATAAAKDHPSSLVAR